MNIYNFNHLFYFYVTAKLDGVTVAAKHLRTSQSSLSTQIRTLEAVLGKKLFKKAGRKMELTDAGRELYGYCRRGFEVFEEMFDQLNKKKSSMGVRISVGVSVDIERPFITEALSKISRASAPEKRPLIQLISLPSQQLIQLLRLGEIDLLLTTSAVVDQDLEIAGSFDFPVGAFVSRGSLEEGKSRHLESATLSSNRPFVLPSKLTSLRAEIDRYLMQKKINPICVFESNIISALIRAATDGMGVVMVPQVYISRELRLGKLVAINTKPLWKHRMVLLSSGQGLDEGRRAFADKLVQSLANQVAVIS